MNDPMAYFALSMFAILLIYGSAALWNEYKVKQLDREIARLKAQAETEQAGVHAE